MARTLVRAACMLGAVFALCAGCGRKLPPLPPGMPDPVEIVSAGFVGNEVVVEAGCATAQGSILLMGKPKGICPSCTDDLVKKDERFVEKTGTIRLKDPSPDAPVMVYRLAFRKGGLLWMTGAKIVKKR